jgi:hypothetical protein
VPVNQSWASRDAASLLIPLHLWLCCVPGTHTREELAALAAQIEARTGIADPTLARALTGGRPCMRTPLAPALLLAGSVSVWLSGSVWLHALRNSRVPAWTCCSDWVLQLERLHPFLVRSLSHLCCHSCVLSHLLPPSLPYLSTPTCPAGTAAISEPGLPASSPPRAIFAHPLPSAVDAPLLASEDESVITAAILEAATGGGQG